MTSMDRASEADLVRRLRAGDPSAFDVVHEAYNTRLFNFLARLCQRRELAEDLLEDTWLRLVARAATLRPDTNLAAWLFTVARNVYASYCRARLVEHSHAASLIALWPTPAAQPSPYEAVSAGETGKRLEAALATLPIAYREALVLVVMEGLSAAEAAAVCGISSEAMRQRISRARSLLAKRLDAAQRPALGALKEAKA